MAVLGASSCVCPAQTVQEQIDAADVVFRGELRALSEDWVQPGEPGSWNYAMEALEVWKAELAQRVNVRSPSPNDSDCAVPIEREGEFLVYARRVNEHDEYASDACMGSKRIEDATADLALLGEGHAPIPFSCASTASGGLTAWTVVLLLSMIRRRWRRVKPPRHAG